MTMTWPQSSASGIEVSEGYTTAGIARNRANWHGHQNARSGHSINLLTFAVKGKDYMSRHTRDVELCQVMPPNTYMGWLQKNHPDLITGSGALDTSGFETAAHCAAHAMRLVRESGLFPEPEMMTFIPREKMTWLDD